MAWTYSGNPALDALSEVRFLLGDTDADDPILQDEEIEYVLSIHTDPGAEAHNYVAAAVCAAAAASKFAKHMNKTVGGLSLQYGQRHDQYVALSDRLQKLAKFGPTGKKPQSVGAPQLFGGGKTYLGGDDTPRDYIDDDAQF